MQKEINLAIHPGCEVFICPEVPELYEKGAVGTLANSRYILIELPMLNIPAYTDQVLYDLQLKGLVPIIAHPERNEQIIEHPEILLDMINRGMLAQANVGSITGLFGRKVKKAALKFIEAGLVQFVASDAHSTGRRSPLLSIAAKQIARSYGDELAKALFINNGVLLILNEQIPIHINWKAKKGFVRLI
jgi:protein-tyrosine phosphatase